MVFGVTPSQGRSLLCMHLHAKDVCIDTVSQLYVGVSSEILLKFIHGVLQALP